MKIGIGICAKMVFAKFVRGIIGDHREVGLKAARRNGFLLTFKEWADAEDGVDNNFVSFKLSDVVRPATIKTNSA